MDSKGQDILFNSEMKQKDLMIQMLSERLDEKDETITELKETINDLKDTIAQGNTGGMPAETLWYRQ